MKRYLLLLLVPVLLVCSSCHSHLGNSGVAGLVFGSFYGMCPGGCVKIYQVDRVKLCQDDSAKYVSLDWNYSFKTTRVLSSSQFDMAKGLLDQIPNDLLVNNNKTYGAPDSHDQGGLFIEVYLDGIVRRYRIDNDSTADQSPALLTFKQKVQSVISQLQ